MWTLNARRLSLLRLKIKRQTFEGDDVVGNSHLVSVVKFVRISHRCCNSQTKSICDVVNYQLLQTLVVVCARNNFRIVALRLDIFLEQTFFANRLRTFERRLSDTY